MKLSALYLSIRSCHHFLYLPHHFTKTTVNHSKVFIAAALCASSLAGAQTPPTDLLRLPTLEVRRIHSTVVSMASEGDCSSTSSQEDTIELRDLRFTQVQTTALRPQGIAPDSAVHAQLLKATRQHLQVPESAPLSKPQTLCELQALGAALSATYRSLSGLAAPIFVIDPQEVVDGVLHMQVLEAELESLDLDEAATDLDRDAVLKAMEAQLGNQRGQPMRQAELERGLALVQFITGRSYQAFLSPGDQPLGVKVRLFPKPENKLQGVLSAINRGNDFTGRILGLVALKWQSGLVQGDEINLSYVNSQKLKALRGPLVSYELPLGYQGWRAGATHTHGAYEVGGSLAAAQANGSWIDNAVYLKYPLWRGQVHNGDWTVGTGDLDLKNNTISTQNHSLHSYVWNEFSGTSARASASQTWGLGLTSGRMRFGTATETQTDASSLNRQGLYHLLKLNFQHTQMLGGGVDGVASYRGQWASKNLDAYQKMGVGGSKSVRAFAVGEVSGDQAHVVRVELGHTQNLNGIDHRFSIFYDWGQLCNAPSRWLVPRSSLHTRRCFLGSCELTVLSCSATSPAPKVSSALCTVLRSSGYCT